MIEPRDYKAMRGIVHTVAFRMVRTRVSSDRMWGAAMGEAGGPP